MNQYSKPLVVFDLDETLVYCSEKPYREAQITTIHGHVCIRDGVQEMLEKVSATYDVMLWSNSGKEYISDMLALFWPKHVPLIDVFTSSDSRIKGFEGVGVPHYKDMRKICKKHPPYNLDRIIGVDDWPDTYSSNYGNLVAVTKFKGLPDDELSRLADFLIDLSTSESFRKVEKRYWRRSQVSPAQQTECRSP